MGYTYAARFPVSKKHIFVVFACLIFGTCEKNLYSPQGDFELVVNLMAARKTHHLKQIRGSEFREKYD